MENNLTLDFLKRLAKGIAQQFGNNCEVVVHDLSDNNVERSIVAIENGHVTNRKLGDGPSHVVLEALHGDRSNLKDHLRNLKKKVSYRGFQLNKPSKVNFLLICDRELSLSSVSQIIKIDENPRLYISVQQRSEEQNCSLFFHVSNTKLLRPKLTFASSSMRLLLPAYMRAY